jgi:hypothetical protein
MLPAAVNGPAIREQNAIELLLALREDALHGGRCAISGSDLLPDTQITNRLPGSICQQDRF